MSVQLLEGASAEELMAGFGDDLIGDGSTLLADFSELADQMHAGLACVGGLDGTVNHPIGEIPRSQFAGFRIGDYATHARDLARAIGVDEHLDHELVTRVWGNIQPMGPMIAASGMFGVGSSDRVAPDAPLQTRFLDFIGRRP